MFIYDSVGDECVLSDYEIVEVINADIRGHPVKLDVVSYEHKYKIYARIHMGTEDANIQIDKTLMDKMEIQPVKNRKLLLVLTVARNNIIYLYIKKIDI